MNYPDIDLYKVLGIDYEAPTAVILAAYKALIKECHPDLATTPKEKEIFTQKATELNMARDILLNSKTRKEYDVIRTMRNAEKYYDWVYKQQTDNPTPKSNDKQTKPNPEPSNKPNTEPKESTEPQEQQKNTVPPPIESPQQQPLWKKRVTHFQTRPRFSDGIIGLIVWWIIAFVIFTFAVGIIMSTIELIIAIINWPPESF